MTTLTDVCAKKRGPHQVYTVKRPPKKRGPKPRAYTKSGTKEYTWWRVMLQRCDNPNYRHFPNYGGRGIVVCDRWRVFENFLADTIARGPRPLGGSMDRTAPETKMTRQGCGPRWTAAPWRVLLSTKYTSGPRSTRCPSSRSIMTDRIRPRTSDGPPRQSKCKTRDELSLRWP